MENLNMERHSKRQPPTPEQVRAQQQADAEKDRDARQAALPIIAETSTPPVTTVTSKAAMEAWLSSGAPVNLPRISYDGKEGHWHFADDTTIADTVEWFAFTDQLTVGHRKYGDESTPTISIAGMPSRGFVMTPRHELPDRDEAGWPIGKFSGQPEDPYREFAELPLLRKDSGELFVFLTHSVSGISAVKALCSQQRWSEHVYPNTVPIVRLVSGGFQSRKYGWVHKPQFVRVGHANRDNLFGTGEVPRIDIKTDMQDDIPDFDDPIDLDK